MPAKRMQVGAAESSTHIERIGIALPISPERRDDLINNFRFHNLRGFIGQHVVTIEPYCGVKHTQIDCEAIRQMADDARIDLDPALFAEDVADFLAEDGTLVAFDRKVRVLPGGHFLFGGMTELAVRPLEAMLN